MPADVLLLATERPAMQGVFIRLGHVAPHPFAVELLPIEGTEGMFARVRDAQVVVVDLGTSTPTSVALCATLRKQWPGVPLIAFVCCDRTLTPWQWTALEVLGLHGILDLRSSPEDLVRDIDQVTRGYTVMRVKRAGDAFGFSHGRQDPEGRRRTRGLAPDDLHLLELVCCGLSNHQIAVRLLKSHHTVHHQIDRLRLTLGLRNRTELAAWAGRNGLYEELAGAEEITPSA
jgi:DNA-binding NarL/FixJ family response regulator